MKTKLTLTIKKEIVEKAKQQAFSRGISLSKLFEDMFEKNNFDNEKTPEQLAATRLLKRLEEMKPIQSNEEADKEARRKYLSEKYG